MRKFLCNEDFVVIGKKLASKGDYVNEGDILQSEDGSISLKMELDDLVSSPIFNEVIDRMEIQVKEVNQDDEELVKDWILQIKVNTSRKKLRDIEDFIRQNLVRYL
jgi:hypothetical protein